jgi:glyoxylase-like metal-dependent hydrolase (beta-lactamase superfamily II)
MKFPNKWIVRPAMALFAGIIFLSLFSLPVAAQSTHTISQPGYYRMQVGDFEVTALSDGTIPQDLPKLLTNTQPGEVERLLNFNYQASPVETSVNAYLVKTKDKLLLIDAGTAEAYGPTLGHMLESLAHAGYKPEQVDAVLLTHIHPDHSGGIIQDGKIAFPNATIYVSKPEVDFWFSASNKQKASAGLKPYFESAEKNVGPYLKAGKVKTFEFGSQLFPGITSVASPGHTPGHTFYALESKGQKLVFMGDIMHAAAVQLADPAVTIQYDVDPKAAAAARKVAFANAVKDNYWIAADHISFPGIGHLRAAGTKYSWIPANYSTYITGE